MANLYLVIIAGGSGTRFWPKSTSHRPKQLLIFGGEDNLSQKQSQTLLQQTLERFRGIVPDHQRMIITTELLKNAVIQGVPPSVEILAEPQGRNTAPCVYWGARKIAEKDPDAVMLVMPADHYMSQPAKYVETLKKAAEWAFCHEDLVTLGIQPTRPETGYGYLRLGVRLDASVSCMKVDAFVEKPNLENAKKFLASGQYLWNGGMFLWRARVILKAFDEYMPEMKYAWESSSGNIQKAYPQMTATSIDYGIMEKAKNVVSFALDCGWDDLGSWTSLEEVADELGTRDQGSVVTGGELLSIESQGNIIDVPGKLVATLGVNNLIIVEHGASLLVADKSRAQEIKKIVDELKKKRPDLV